MADTKIAHLTPGSIFAGHFEILEKLGSGGMGSVYKARNVSLDNIVALKVLHYCRDGAPAPSVQRFQREAHAISSLHHPNIISVHTFGVEGDDCYMSMDYLPGLPLSDLLQQRGKLSPDEASSIALQAASALAHAHDNGVVHRDIKPSNIMLIEGDAGAMTVKIVDFGIAKLLVETGESAQKLTKTDAMIGTPFYMSPEQCDKQPIDGRSDIYSLGCVLYQLLSGDPPFLDDSLFAVMYAHVHNEPGALPNTVPEWLSAVTARMMQKSPSDRFQSMSEVAECIRQQRAPNAVPRKPARQRMKLARTPIMALGIGLAAAMSTGAMWWLDFQKHSMDNVESSVLALVKEERNIENGDSAERDFAKWMVLTRARDRIANYRKLYGPPADRWAPLVFVVSQGMLEVGKNVSDNKRNVTDRQLAEDWLDAANQSNNVIEKVYAYNAMLGRLNDEERAVVIRDAGRALEAVDLGMPEQLSELNSDPRRTRLLESSRRIAHSMEPVDDKESRRLFLKARQLSERIFPGSSQAAFTDLDQAVALFDDGKRAEAAKLAAIALPTFEENIPRGNDNAQRALECLQIMLAEAKTASEREKLLHHKAKLEAQKRGGDG